MSRLLIPILLLIATMWAVIECTDTRDRADVILVTSGEVFTLDPQRMSYLGDMRMGGALYEGLVRLDLEGDDFKPAAASGWEQSEEGRTWTFHLRPEGRWSDGSPVTAHDFAWSWLRLLSPDTAADYSNLFFMIKGSRDYWQWRTSQLEEAALLNTTPDGPALWEAAEAHFADTVGIEVVGDYTLRLRLEHPVPWLLDLLAFAPASPVHRPTVEGWPPDPRIAERGWHATEKPRWDDRRFISFDPATGRLLQDHRWARAGVLVGNGPYVLDTWRYKRDMRLRKSATWWNRQSVRSETIATVTIEDPNTAVLAYESGSVDWINGVNVDYRADLIEQARDGLRDDVHVVPAFATDFFSFNCRPELPGGGRNPFADAGVRRAFALAVDRQRIVQHVTRLHEPTTTTLVPRNSVPGYNSPRGLGLDPDAARKELAAAGWVDRDLDGRVELEDGTTFPVVQLLYTTNTPRYKRIAIALREQWERELGVPIELVGRDTKFYKSDLRAGNFMIARGTWYGDFGDPTTFLDLCRSTDGNNDRGFVDERVDAALDAASRETNTATRMEMLADLEEYLFQEAVPMIPICQVVDVLLYDPGSIDGVTHHPRQVQSLWEIGRPGETKLGSARP